MTDWITKHKGSIQFTLWTAIGVFFILIGVINEREPAMIALGAGAIGLPGFSGATGRRDDEA